MSTGGYIVIGIEEGAETGSIYKRYAGGIYYVQSYLQVPYYIHICEGHISPE